MTTTEIILYIAVSVDGYIAAKDGTVDWLSCVDDAAEDYGYAAFYDSVDALVMGSHTYEQLLGFDAWPYPGKTSYIMTERDLPCDRDDVQLVSRDAAATMQTMQADGHQRIWLVGGGQLASHFHQQQLISEYQLFIIPVALGQGIALFAGQQMSQPLELIHSRPYSKGVIELHYRPCGDLARANNS